MLKYVQNKDVFMRYHKAHLTRRLILETSVDNEIEENMVDWLRVCNQLFSIISKCSTCILFWQFGYLVRDFGEKQRCYLVYCNESNILIIQCELTPHGQADLMFCFDISKALDRNTVWNSSPFINQSFSQTLVIWPEVWNQLACNATRIYTVYELLSCLLYFRR